MSVVEDVVAELDRLGVKSGALRSVVLAMARELDDLASEEECEECGHVQSWTTGRNSATSKSMCAKVLMEGLAQVRAMAPPKKQEDRVDEIAQRRGRRVAGGGA